MNILTPYGYKNIEDLNIGDEIIAYDINTGNIITNYLEEKKLWTLDEYEDEYGPYTEIYHKSGNIVYNESGSIQHDCLGNILYDEYGNILYYKTSSIKLDCNGNPVYDGLSYYETIPGQLIYTKEELYNSSVENRRFYRINDTWNLYKYQSIWANLRVTHAEDLQIGDIIYNGSDNDVTIFSLEEITSSNWWKIKISGDHSYIADNLTLHNASRYWVGGGSTNNWNATSNTNWGSTSGTQDNSSVPTAADDAIFDGAGVAGNTDSNINTTFTVSSLIISSSYTSIISHSANLTIYNGVLELNPSSPISASTARVLTISGSATMRPNNVQWPGGLTLTGDNTTKVLSGSFLITGSFVWNGASPCTLNSTSGSYIITYGGILPTGTSNIRGTGGIVFARGRWYLANQLACQYGLADIIISGSVEMMGRCTVGVSGFTTTFNLLSGSISASKGGDTYGPELQHRGGTVYLKSTPGLFLTNNITYGSTGTYILLSDIYSPAPYAAASAPNGIVVLSGNTGTETLYLNGLYLYNAAGIFSGSANVVFTGSTANTNIAQPPTTGYFGLKSITFRGSGSISSGAPIYPIGGGCTLIYDAGSWNTNGVTLQLVGNNTLDLKGSSGLVFDRVSFTGANTTILSSSLYVSRSLSISANTTFTSSIITPASWSCQILTSSATTTITATLQNNVPYEIRNFLTVNTARVGSNILFTSNNAVTRSILILNNRAACNTSANFTRIDASLGRPINTWNGTVTDCVNVRSFYDKQVLSIGS